MAEKEEQMAWVPISKKEKNKNCQICQKRAELKMFCGLSVIFSCDALDCKNRAVEFICIAEANFNE